MDSKTTIILKAATIILMLSCVIAVITTATINKMLGYDLEVVSWHYYAGIIFAITLPIHIFLMRRWLVRLFKQIYHMALQKEYAHTCTSELLPNALKKKSLQEICDFFEVDKATMIPILLQKKIYKCDMQSTLEKIASENDYEITKIINMILERPEWKAFAPKNMWRMQTKTWRYS